MKPIFFVFFVIFGWSVENIAAVSCHQTFRDSTIATHFVEVLDGQFQLGLDVKPPKNRENTMVFLDGFSLSFKHSQRFANAARRLGIPLVRVDMVGVGNSLKKQWDTQGQFGRNNKIPAELQVDAVISFIETTFNKPVILAGLSYGGGIAAMVAKKRPDLIKNLALIGPFVIDLAQAHPVASNFTIWAQLNPFAHMLMQGQRKTFLEASFRRFVPQYLKETPEVYFNAIFELSEGIRPYDLREILKDLEVSTDMLFGEKDKAIGPTLYRASFDQLPANSRGRLIELEGAPHDLIGSHPDFIAQRLFDGFYQ